MPHRMPTNQIFPLVINIHTITFSLLNIQQRRITNIVSKVAGKKRISQSFNPATALFSPLPHWIFWSFIMGPWLLHRYYLFRLDLFSGQTFQMNRGNTSRQISNGDWLILLDLENNDSVRYSLLINTFMSNMVTQQFDSHTLSVATERSELDDYLTVLFNMALHFRGQCFTATMSTLPTRQLVGFSSSIREHTGVHLTYSSTDASLQHTCPCSKI